MSKPDAKTVAPLRSTPAGAASTVPSASPSSGAAPTDDRNPLEVLAEEFAERCRSGVHVSVSDYVQNFPQYADQLRELLPSIALMEKLKHRNSSGNRAASALLKLERLGDFRIVRELGRGGMGVVYEAHQESLGRHVAVKVLNQASLLDNQRLQRFQREARAAGRLHHTNIVPVFGVGEQEGLHYYVMQYIEGRALNQVVAGLALESRHPATITGSALRGSRAPVDPEATPGPQEQEGQTPRSGAAPSRVVRSASGSAGGNSPTPLPSPDASRSRASSHGPAQATPPHGRRYWLWAADVGRQVADALHYAHVQGTLHRDIKPANLLLDPHGTVWVTDFGLAKLTEELHDVTRSGDVVGTLQYMPPEGLQSKADVRSDVYGLGVTLYELLTLRPPFQQESPAALMRSIAETEPARPRKVQPLIPRDLETIILKAIARDPAARYQTADLLAEDLDNYIHDRPILARRASVGERLWRWGRRNRGLAAAGAVTICSLLLALVVGWIGYATAHRALKSEAERRIEAEIATAKAEKNVQLSLAAFENIFNQLGQQDSENSDPGAAGGRGEGPGGPVGPGAQGGNAAAPPPAAAAAGGRRPPRLSGAAVDTTVLQAILNFYDQFAKQNETNLALHADAARSYQRIGDVYWWLGQDAQAQAAYERAASMYELLMTRRSSRNDDVRGLAAAAASMPVSTDTAARDRQSSRIELAKIALAKVATNTRGDEDDQFLLGSVTSRLATIRSAEGKSAEAEKAYREALELWANVRRPPRPGDPVAIPGPTDTAIALAALLSKNGADTQAREVLRQAIRVEQPHQRGPRSPGRERLALIYDALAAVDTRLKDTSGAADATGQAARLRSNRGGREGDPGGPPDGPDGEGPGRRGGPPDAGDNRPPGPPDDGPFGGRPDDGPRNRGPGGSGRRENGPPDGDPRGNRPPGGGQRDDDPPPPPPR